MDACEEPTVDKAEPAKGEFRILVKDKDGNVVQEDVDHNMIVNASKTALAMLISEENCPQKVIRRFGVGTDGSTATPADDSLTASYLNNLISHEFPEPGVVRFKWALGYGEANGMAVSEFGLFCDDGSLFARKTRPSIHKGDDLSFEGEWSIIF